MPVTVPHTEVIKPHDTDELLPNEVTPGNITELLPDLVTLLLQLLSVIENLTNNNDPLLPNRLLSEAADKGYILTSKQIKDILGIKISSIYRGH